MDGLLHQRGGLLHFLQTDVHRAGDVDKDALGPLDRGLQQGAGNGHTGGFLGLALAGSPTHAHVSHTCVLHNGRHVGKVQIDEAGVADQVGNGLHRLLENIVNLVYILKTKIYRPGVFRVFYVYEPKKRLVQAPAFVDKVVQHAIVDNLLYDRITRSFILDNYASQKNKGLHFGLDRLKGFFTDYWNKHHTAEGWVLKCDVRHFFASINHDKLKEKLKKLDLEPVVYDLLCIYIDCSDGLPLGYQTSQLFALLFLDDFDHFVKEQLHIQYYGRYMDDFFLIHPDKEYLQFCLREIRAYMDSLGLELNEKTQIFPIRNGIDFLGFHTYLTESGKVIRKLRHSSIKRMRAKLRHWEKEYPAGLVTREQILQSWQAWDAHAAHGNTWALRQQVRDRVQNILKEEI